MAEGRETEEGDTRRLLERAFDAAVAAADPGRIPGGVLPGAPSGRIRVCGAGKAAAAMAAAVERHYGTGVVVEGLVVAPDGTAGRRPSGAAASRPSRIEVALASHPVPDRRGVEATARILELVESCREGDRLIVLLSGGGSALLSAPDGVTLAEKVELSQALLRSGAPIEEINTVRKHLSKVKGGRLALAARPTPLTALVLSDVVGDDLSAIASGPTVADPTTFGDALAVLDRYGIESPAARELLEAGKRGRRPETPKPGDPRLDHVESHLVGNNQGSLEAAAGPLREAGYRVHILSSRIVGEAREAGRTQGAIVRQVLERGQPFPAPCALISGGETTVTVRSVGRGGRNSEFALGLALELPADAPVWVLAADTDGRDGSEENAGVFVTPELLAGIDRRRARSMLDRNDSYGIFAELRHLLVTGPTGTNVNDLRIILVGRPATGYEVVAGDSSDQWK